MNDDELVSQALAEAEICFSKRKKEFIKKLGITDQDYEEANKIQIDYMALIGSIRPFARSPLATESFIAGYLRGKEKWR